MADLGELTERVFALEQWRVQHLGPRQGATSLNQPHVNSATATDLDALDARVSALEADVATLQASMTTAQSSITALQAAVITSGRYL